VKVKQFIVTFPTLLKILNRIPGEQFEMAYDEAGFVGTRPPTFEKAAQDVLPRISIRIFLMYAWRWRTPRTRPTAERVTFVPNDAACDRAADVCFKQGQTEPP
jgi:hypothetical protein